jgi:hypothetical protein
MRVDAGNRMAQKNFMKSDLCSPPRKTGQARQILSLFLGVFVLVGGCGSGIAQFSISVPQSLKPQTPSGATNLALSAVIEGTQTLLKDGVSWRVYDAPADKRASLIASSKDAAPRFDLPPGAYIVHVTYGLASASRRIILSQQAVTERIPISAGGLSLSARVGDIPIPNDRVTFSIYVAQGSDPEGRLVAENISTHKVLYLPSGLYRVVSRYGRTNAIATADLRIDSGVLSQATLTHRAATVTLKLVHNKGAEALGGTRFSVLTPGGDIVREISGAFPTLTLAEGDYLILARNGGKLYSEDAVIKSGFDRDIEVLTSNLVNTDEAEANKKQ